MNVDNAIVKIHEFHLLLIEYVNNQVSKLIFDKTKDVIVEPLDLFSFQKVNLVFQPKSKTRKREQYITKLRYSIALVATDISNRNGFLLKKPAIGSIHLCALEKVVSETNNRNGSVFNRLFLEKIIFQEVRERCSMFVPSFQIL